jgi:hypothetical protein
VERLGIGSLGITALYNDVYKPALNKVLAILDFIKKSFLTREIKEQDRVRDGVTRGFIASAKALTRHPDPAKRAAAERVMMIFDAYGDLADRSYDDQTAAIDDVIREFDIPEIKALLVLLALVDWYDQLKKANKDFTALMDARYVEIGHRPELNMKEARAVLDDALQSILERVEAQVTLYGLTSTSSDYAPFVREYNALAERYKNILASQRGRRASKNEEEKEEEA